MRKGNLSKEQAVSLVGLEAVEKVEEKNCDFTARLQTDGDDAVEFSASVTCVDKDGSSFVLVAYYYQNEDDVATADDLSDLDWEISGYEVI